jgi:BirA family biotin operon repressor/biotin-[acetyl-CoA-carboxylase] ligase
MSSSNLLFNILDQVDSTNNYAMEMISKEQAIHGNAYLAHYQTEGRGQRGKKWDSLPGQNLTMSVVLKPSGEFIDNPFLFNAFIAVEIASFVEDFIQEKVMIKWPNDIYIRDRKAGGILIENKIRGENWNWSVTGIGLNINQFEFINSPNEPISLIEITKQTIHIEEFARALHGKLLKSFASNSNTNGEKILQDYNDRLFKAGKAVQLKKNNVVFETTIKEVNLAGQLITVDVNEQHFEFGEVEWILT